MTSLSNIQFKKGLDFTLDKSDFPELAYDSTAFIEACRTFPWFFMTEFQLVIDVDGQEKPFKLSKAQRYLERMCTTQQKFHKYVHLIILKGRQYRVSTYFARRGLHFAIWNNHKYTILANTKEDVAEEGVFGYALEGLRSLQLQSEDYPFLKSLIKTRRIKEAGALIQFDGDSHGKIDVRAATKAAVGKPCQFAHITEPSRIPHFGVFWGAFYQGLHISEFHHLILESTAFFQHPEFMEIFNEQWDLEKERGSIPSFRAVFIPPYMVDEYMGYELPSEDYSWDEFWEDENEDIYGCEREIVTQQWWDDFDKTYITLPLNFMKWRRDQIEGQKKEEHKGFSKLDVFKENFPMTKEEAELTFGDNVFDHKALDKRKYFPYIIQPESDHIGTIKLIDEVPTFTPRDKGEVTVWSTPEEGYWYTIGIDAAWGRRGDSSVGVVWSPIKNHVACRFKSNQWSLHELVEIGIAVARWYNNAIVAYESNYYGDTLLQKFLGMDNYNPVGAPYTRLYKEPILDKKRGGQYSKTLTNARYGFRTHVNSKPQLIAILKDLINDDEAGLYSQDLINEMWFFHHIYDDDGNIKKTQAPKSKHDDELIATAIAVFVARDYLKRNDMQVEFSADKILDPIKDYDKIRADIRKKNKKHKGDNLDKSLEREINRIFANRGVR